MFMLISVCGTIDFLSYNQPDSCVAQRNDFNKRNNIFLFVSAAETLSALDAKICVKRSLRLASVLPYM